MVVPAARGKSIITAMISGVLDNRHKEVVAEKNVVIEASNLKRSEQGKVPLPLKDTRPLKFVLVYPSHKLAERDLEIRNAVH